MTRTTEQHMSGDSPGAPAEIQLRIHETAELVGLTPRSIRYYEEMGLLSPSARSQGAYRLFDQLDVDRLRFIKGLRDDAGFSIAEVRLLLEDEAARRLAREAFDATDEPAERRRILNGRLASIDEQLAGVRGKVARLQAMVGDLEVRRQRVLVHLAELADAPADPRAGR
ncbi:MAG TPA: MerR family transcriptional regulator [Candidatus Limnocylindrales bacterium]